MSGADPEPPFAGDNSTGYGGRGGDRGSLLVGEGLPGSSTRLGLAAAREQERESSPDNDHCHYREKNVDGPIAHQIEESAGFAFKYM
jgi:hypothetical protein